MNVLLYKGLLYGGSVMRRLRIGRLHFRQVLLCGGSALGRFYCVEVPLYGVPP
jgi:hypothetical protein